jgi:hypothetical protein
MMLSRLKRKVTLPTCASEVTIGTAGIVISAAFISVSKPGKNASINLLHENKLVVSRKPTTKRVRVFFIEFGFINTKIIGGNSIYK